ncbi:hypothetical protein CRG98_020981 [Punica granatum]|uniref:Uncharacterized protein n=1 Tax=Punica granatum TaxID=22663 RepID=A0A2I0JT29_PUNGR|nr:hypothetical protein CRG98_020981 [Punica granatum]
MAGKGLDRDRRTSLDSCEPQGLTATLEEMWPRVPLDHTSLRRLLPFRNGSVPAFHALPSKFVGAYRLARVESHYEPPITVILSQLGVQCHRPYIKRPPGASCGAVSSSGASRTRSLVSWESNATGPARKFHPDQPVQPRQTGLPVGSTADPTLLIRVCSFQGAEPTSQALFPALLDFSRIPGLGIIIPTS